MIFQITYKIIKEIKFNKIYFAEELFNLSCRYILNTNFKSFYQVELFHEKEIKIFDSKFPYFICIVLNILNNFLNNESNNKNKIKEKNNKNKLISNSAKETLAKIKTQENEFNLNDDQNIEIFFNFLEKIFYFVKEIIDKDKDIFGKLKKNNTIVNFKEDDFNENILKFFINSETVFLNETFNFFINFLNFKKAEKILKEKIIKFFFENFDNLIFSYPLKKDELSNFNLIQENLFKNYLLKDENLLLSLICLIHESLNEQYFLKAEDIFKNLDFKLDSIKHFLEYVINNKENILSPNVFNNLIILFDKIKILISSLKEKIKQINLMNENLNKIKDADIK
jgi:hypothetical protein